MTNQTTPPTTCPSCGCPLADCQAYASCLAARSATTPMVRLQVGAILTPANLPSEYETEGLVFEVRLEDVVELRLRNPLDCIDSDQLKPGGVLGGWPIVYLDEATGLLVLESCWGWPSGEDRIYCKAVTVATL